MIRILGAVLLVHWLMPAQVSEERPLSVCELLAKRAQYDRKEVTVRAVWVATTHGSNLQSTDGFCTPKSDKAIIWLNTSPGAADLPKRAGEEDEFRSPNLNTRLRAMFGWVAEITLTGIFETFPLKRSKSMDMEGYMAQRSVGLLTYTSWKSPTWVTSGTHEDRLKKPAPSLQ